MKRKFVILITLVMTLLLVATLVSACDDSGGKNVEEGFTMTFRDGSATVSKVLLKPGEALKAEQIPAQPQGHDGQQFLGYFIGDVKVEAGYTATQNVVAYARFRVGEFYALSLNFDSSKGNVTVTAAGSGGKYASGASVTVNVTPNRNYVVGSVTLNGAPVQLSGGNYTFNITSDSTINVAFEAEEESARYTLTLDYDPSKGNVTVTAADPDGKYAAGERVTITVTPSRGYVVGSVTLNGAAVQLSGGNYTFAIDSNSTIRVVFAALEEPVPAADLLSGISGSVRFEGTMTNHDYFVGDEVTTEEFCLFDTAACAVWTYTIADGEYYFYAVYKDVDGIVNIVTHDNKGKLQLIEGKDSLTGAAVPFSDYSNPFADISADDLQYIGDYKWQISDLALAKVVARNITGYTEDVESFVLTAQGGKFVALDIVIARFTDESGNFDYQYIYHYDISEHGSAAVPAEWLGDYSMSAKQIELKTALEQAAAAGSYTINFHSEEIGEENLDYHIYVTPDAIYEDNVGWESGYYLRGDGRVWSFSYDDGEVSFDEPQSETIAQLGAQFVLSDIDYSMLEYVGDGAYRVRDVDVMLLGSYTGATSSVAYAFGVGDRQRYFQAAYDVTIYLKGGKLWKVELSYDLGQIAEDIVMTFEAFGSTELPIVIEDNEDFSSWSNYVGTYESSDASYVVEITEDDVSVLIDGEQQEVEILGFSKTYGFELIIDGVNYELYSYDEGAVQQLELTLADGSGDAVFLTRRSAQTECDWTAYIGTFEGINNDGVPCTVAIDETTITVTIGEETYTFDAAGSYQQDYMGGYFLIEIDGVMWDISSDEYHTDEFSSIVMFPDDNVRNYFELTRKSGGSEGGGGQGGGPSAQGNWSRYIGTYADSDGKYVVEITATEVKVTIDGVAATVSIVEYDVSEGFTLTVNGIEMLLYDISYSEGVYDGTIVKIAFMSSDYQLRVTLNRIS